MDAETEAKFVEQEHRLVRIIVNVLEYRRADPDDPRKKAALKALVWRIFSPGTAAAVGLGGARGALSEGRMTGGTAPSGTSR